MILKDLGGTCDHHRNYGNSALFGDLKAAFVKGQEGIVHLVAGAFRENTDRNAFFHLLYAQKNGLQPFLDIFSVQKQALNICHPDIEKRPLFHFFFGHVAGDAWEQSIGKHNVKIAAVIGNIEHGGVPGDIFQPPGLHPCSGQKGDTAEAPAYDSLGVPVLALRVELSYDPLCDHKRNRQDQKQNHIDHNQNKSYHIQNLQCIFSLSRFYHKMNSVYIKYEKEEYLQLL